jgi:hypothetical protein
MTKLMNPFRYDVNGPGGSRHVARCVNINIGCNQAELTPKAAQVRARKSEGISL